MRNKELKFIYIIFKDFIKTKKYLYLMAILAGLLLGVIFGSIFLNIPSVNFWLSDFKNNLLLPNTTFLSDIIAFLSIIIGVSIPISIDTVNKLATRLGGPELASYLIKEDIYKAQKILLFINITAAIILRFLNIISIYLLFPIFLLIIVNIIIFFRYIKTIEEYTLNAEQKVINRLTKNVEDFLKR